MNQLEPAEVKCMAKRTKKAALEQKFLTAWKLAYPTLPQPALQHKFAAPERQWRFDFAWVDQYLAVELQGGAFNAGGHVRGVQQAKDYEKQNAAVALGWRVLFFNTMQAKDMNAVVDFVAEVLTNAKEIGV